MESNQVPFYFQGLSFDPAPAQALDVAGALQGLFAPPPAPITYPRYASQ
jgi:hypothetical protein